MARQGLRARGGSVIGIAIENGRVAHGSAIVQWLWLLIEAVFPAFAQIAPFLRMVGRLVGAFYQMPINGQKEALALTGGQVALHDAMGKGDKVS